MGKWDQHRSQRELAAAFLGPGQGIAASSAGSSLRPNPPPAARMAPGGTSPWGDGQVSLTFPPSGALPGSRGWSPGWGVLARLGSLHRGRLLGSSGNVTAGNSPLPAAARAPGSPAAAAGARGSCKEPGLPTAPQSHCSESDSLPAAGLSDPSDHCSPQGQSGRC